MKKRGKDISKLEIVLDILLSGEDLPIKYKDHQLRGEFQDFRECHIEPDWLLIYRKSISASLRGGFFMDNFMKNKKEGK